MITYQFLARGYTAHESCLRQGVDRREFMDKVVHAFICQDAAAEPAASGRGTDRVTATATLKSSAMSPP